ncbi:MAG TPA: SRPBCC domain-containing protein [Candidatus Dormibacteraeota bacterium]|nr:SRPBCC domain-containing protein [Candidatus Dormibacteraeota bacterium]
MKYFEARSSIKSSPQNVWRVLTDGERFPQWDSGIERFEGKIAQGGTVKLYVKVNPGRAFPLKVTELTANRRMVFSGGMPLGLFKGVRTYTLEPGAAGGTDFHMREEYTGPLLGMMWKSIPDLGPSFQQFADGLKKEAEKS